MVGHDPGAAGGSDHGHVHPLPQGLDTGPPAGALLAGAVEDVVDEVPGGQVVLPGEDIGGDADEVAVQLPPVPGGEGLGQLPVGEAPRVFQQEIGLGDELHIGILNAVVDHFDIVPRASGADVGTAGLVVLRPGRDGLQDGAHRAVSLPGSAGHDGGTPAGSLLAAGDAHAEVVYPRLRQRFGPAVRVLKIGVAPVHDNIPPLQEGKELLQHRIHRRPGLDHQKHLPGALQRGDQRLQAVKPGQVFVGMLPQHPVRHLRAAVVARHTEAVVRHIERQAAAHDRKTHQPDVVKLIHIVILLFPVQGGHFGCPAPFL